MKNIYKSFSLALTVLGILIFTTTACSDDDKNATPNESLQGLWRLTELKYVPMEAPAAEDEEATSSEAEADEEEVETEDPSTLYPDVDGVQPYLRFGTSTYTYFEVTTADTTTRETGNYTLANNEITTESTEPSTSILGYEITGKQLIMIETHSEAEIFYYAEKVVGDPFLEEAPSENEEPENPDEEEVTGCAIYHDTENAPYGSSLNPILIETGVEITDSLYAIDGKNGHEAKFYLQVEPYTAFRIHLKDLLTDYADVHNLFKYTSIHVTDAFSTDQVLYTTKIEDGQKQLQFDLFTTTSCLYIEFFSYQEGVKFLFEVEDLSGTQE
ncbi:hypothetical protein [Geofilum rubicundum]|uniref:Lipocalin-like domain-containing protein n=1 Tax=Geofilum rubicundum JCM 15548 TaxID=1236989 RepID=A0A0E9LSR4_9BACT|nr:hypothetical protein [Geofilum rubicundum]GAO28338.1 hypothetical protein JCM15548_1422 [Geofilum rubicundum JCM 15548]